MVSACRLILTVMLLAWEATASAARPFPVPSLRIAIPLQRVEEWVDTVVAKEVHYSSDGKICNADAYLRDAGIASDSIKDLADDSSVARLMMSFQLEIDLDNHLCEIVHEKDRCASAIALFAIDQPFIASLECPVKSPLRRLNFSFEIQPLLRLNRIVRIGEEAIMGRGATWTVAFIPPGATRCEERTTTRTIQAEVTFSSSSFEPRLEQVGPRRVAVMPNGNSLYLDGVFGVTRAPIFAPDQYFADHNQAAIATGGSDLVIVLMDHAIGSATRAKRSGVLGELLPICISGSQSLRDGSGRSVRFEMIVDSARSGFADGPQINLGLGASNVRAWLVDGSDEEKILSISEPTVAAAMSVNRIARGELSLQLQNLVFSFRYSGHGIHAAQLIEKDHREIRIPMAAVTARTTLEIPLCIEIANADFRPRKPCPPDFKGIGGASLQRPSNAPGNSATLAFDFSRIEGPALNDRKNALVFRVPVTVTQP